jgi:hypothetical protein
MAYAFIHCYTFAYTCSIDHTHIIPHSYRIEYDIRGNSYAHMDVNTISWRIDNAT